VCDRVNTHAEHRATAELPEASTPAALGSRDATASEVLVGHVPGLDGVRAIAVLAVAAFHGGVPFMKGGYLGVDIFFVLSGFLITSILLKEHARTGSISLPDFYARRALRLLPALLLLLAVFLVYAMVGARTSRGVYFRQALYALLYVGNWMRAYDKNDLGLLGHTWSLSIEEQFYLLWPAALVLMNKLRFSRQALLAATVLLGVGSYSARAIMCATGVSESRIYHGLDTRVETLLVGCTLAMLFRGGLSQRLAAGAGTLSKGFRVGYSLVVVTGLAVLFHSARHADVRTYYWIPLAIEGLSVMLILEAMIPNLGVLRPVLENGLAVWIGRISYGIYLWHFPVFGAVRKRLHADWPTVIVLGGAIAVAASAASYWGIERRALRLKRRFERA
jgi:peptidoglycan/LPS O-acetylase OafA/YrhL